MQTQIGKLEREDLVAWRAIGAKLAAIEHKPEGYSTSEIEATYLRKYQMLEGFMRRYGITDDRKRWNISLYDGSINQDSSEEWDL